MDIVKFKAKQKHQNDASGKKRPLPKMPNSRELEMLPKKTVLGWSTLQVRKKIWKRKVQLPILDGQDSPRLHILVGCQSRFQTGAGDMQRYALAIRLWHSDADVKVYQYVRSHARLQSHVRVHTRG